MIKTTCSEFDRMAKQHPLVPVAAEILGDLDTPVSTFLKIARGSYRFLLESVEGATQRGRFSIIGDTPYLIFKSKDRNVTVRNVEENTGFTVESNPLDVLQSLIRKYAGTGLDQIPFSSNGFFGYLGYDTVRHIEKLPDESVDDVNVPDIHMFIPQRVIVFDNLLNTMTLILFVCPGNTIVESYEKAVSRINQMIDTIRAGVTLQMPSNRNTSSEPEANLSQNEYEGMVMQAKKHIKRGDIFQIVLAQRLKMPTSVSPFQIYRGLRLVNPSPYMFFMHLDDVEVLGSSPETLVKLKDDTVFVKPIAGTCRRGSNDDEDERLVKDLLNDPKERAEHNMLVDLGRNDIGRIAAYGSVKVTDSMAIEKYSHVMHIVSTVQAKLANNMDAVDVFKACFPAGTLTGAPKVKAMELIDRLEPNRRGIYGGAVGYMTFNGDMDVCIAIRTIYVKNKIAYLQAGAGIVADSIPEREYQETLNKAHALQRALSFAEGGLR